MSPRRVEIEIGTVVVHDPRVSRDDLGRALVTDLTRLLAGTEAVLPAGDRSVATATAHVAHPGDRDGAGVGRAVASATFGVLGG